VTRGRAVLAALLVAGLVLIGVEAERGASTHLPAIANPCRPRPPLALGGIQGTIQGVVLAGLDRAACRLGISREALVLRLAGSSAGGRRLSRKQLDPAVRAGLLGALDEAVRRGAVPAFLRPLLAKVIRSTPLDALVHGRVAIPGLLG
jgi:hypothetical protein